MGASVYYIKEPTDLLCGYRGKTVVVEVKRLIGKRDPKPSRFTPQQLAFFRDWKGGPVATVCDVDSAIRLLRGLDAQLLPAEPAQVAG